LGRLKISIIGGDQGGLLLAERVSHCQKPGIFLDRGSQSQIPGRGLGILAKQVNQGAVTCRNVFIIGSWFHGEKRLGKSERITPWLWCDKNAALERASGMIATG
jgi:hypothetical protein